MAISHDIDNHCKLVDNLYKAIGAYWACMIIAREGGDAAHLADTVILRQHTNATIAYYLDTCRRNNIKPVPMPPLDWE